MPSISRASVLVALALAACASTQKPPEHCEELPLELVFAGGKMLNVNSEGQSMPVEVRTYFLKSRDKIDSLDFETLWQKPEESLGPSMLKATSLTIRPGEEKITTINAPGPTEYLAVVGVFRQVEGDQWRRVVDIRRVGERCKPGDLHTQIRAELSDNRVVAKERVE